MNTRHHLKFWIDVTLFVLFGVACLLQLTGLALHQWIGIAAGLLAAYHLITHWEWVKAVSKRFLGKTSSQARLFYLVDAALLGGFLTILGSGVIISSWLNLALENYAGWRTLHVLATIVTLLATTLKVGLHWRWIANQVRLFAARRDQALRPQAVLPGPVTSRREFLKVATATGAAMIIPLSASFLGLENTAEASSTTLPGAALSALTQTGSTASSAASSTTSSSTTTTSTKSCSVRCNRGCSYPGHCRRYTDSNKNNRCDLGECL